MAGAPAAIFISEDRSRPRMTAAESWKEPERKDFMGTAYQPQLQISLHTTK